MSKIRQSARGETCTFQIPGVCNNDPETVVLCHAPHPDKGMGYKSHPASEIWSAYGCSACHDEMDGRTFHWAAPSLNQSGFLRTISQKDDVEISIIKDWYWLHAIRETQRRLIAKGLMPK